MPNAPVERSVTLGSGVSSVAVSPLCIGATSAECVIAAWDAGINFFFVTADMHWPLYEGLRQGLVRLAKECPEALEQAVIACVCYTAQPEFQTMPFEEVVTAIAPFKKIDVAVVGGSYEPDVEKRLKVLRDNVEKKRVTARFTASSFHDRTGALKAINEGLADLAFVRYNSWHPGGALDLFPHLKADRKTRIFNFKSTYGYRPPKQFHDAGFDPEMWLPEVVDHYRFVRCRPEIDGILCSPRSPKQLEELIAAYQQGPLSVEEENHVLQLTKVLIDHAEKSGVVQHQSAGTPV